MAPPTPAETSHRAFHVPGTGPLTSGLIFLLSIAGAVFAQMNGFPISAALIFVLGVTVIGAISGLRGGLIAAISASIIFNFFLSEPALQFGASSADDYVPLLAFNLCAIISGILAGQLNDRARRAEIAGRRLDTLFSVSERLQKAIHLPDIVDAVDRSKAGGQWNGFELYDVDGAFIAGEEPAPRWQKLAKLAPPERQFASSEQRASVYRLESKGETLGYAVFGWLADAPGGADMDMDALVAILTIAVERCLLLEKVSQTEALRRSEDFKTALLSSLSHDMRTPLSAISASVSSLLSLSDDLDPDVRRKLLLTIQEQGERLDRYTANLLDLGRLQGGIGDDQMTQVDVIDVMGTVLRSARATATAHVFSKHFDCADAMVRANAVMLEQIFSNILDNATRYSEDGSTIAIRIARNEWHVGVEIIDEGCGIPAADLPNVFNRFYRSDRTSHYEGQGLGLSIAKGFVDAFQGTIHVISPHAGGQGTQVLISLPLARQQALPDA